MALTESIYTRRSVRSFASTPLTQNQLSQVLWAGNGTEVDAISGPTRTAPSAGARYPVELYVVTGAVDGIDPGVYSYSPKPNTLQLVRHGDFRTDLARAAVLQRFIARAPAILVVGVVYRRTTVVYGERGRERYARMDAGHSAQNIILQATALDLGSVTVGAFSDERIVEILRMDKSDPLYIIPIGQPAR